MPFGSKINVPGLSKSAYLQGDQANVEPKSAGINGFKKKNVKLDIELANVDQE